MEKKLKEINHILIIEGYIDERKEMAESLQQEWDNRCLQEEIFWRQKSRVQWIKEGERNTKLFHRSTIANRNNNRIVKLKGQHGIERNTHEEMEKVLLQHFRKLLRKPQKINTSLWKNSLSTSLNWSPKKIISISIDQ